ncbi:alkaline phosphatase, tissue-nonspecific isozyme-like [Mercenaria mercenaria]|uniref:alkaline phosphatase, tissue-nonspecific isozyme-like n=1 Tax=Mercenaria mercenaria TaxID=6596 RepID=UPI00234F4450|nr:alkaline phosphatase, tissue-nonspecific isozyme-like [Mercenaria mercenaria]
MLVAKPLCWFSHGTAHLANALTAPNIPPGEKDPLFWRNLAKDRIQKRKQQVEINKIAKNLILFIGDGMGPTTVTAARILRGQLNNRPGEESVLAFEEFPNVALSKTKPLAQQGPLLPYLVV